ncbi:MAG TPA: type II toxin-antitoxin system death-on-curing family toxin [Acidobacteriaceae bacterium]
MGEPAWIEKPEVLIAHSRQLAEHGGSDGLRDENLLDSALAKPKNVFAYEESPTLERLAASCAFGIARNHPFVDGNKRTALVVAEAFLIINGVRISAPPADKYAQYLGLAAGEVSEDSMAAWFGRYAVRV